MRLDDAMPVNDWFLTAPERDNPWTRIDRRHGDVAHTTGNTAILHVHGAEYFARLRQVVEAMGEGDLLLFTDWRGDPDEKVDETGLTMVQLFGGAARRGVVVKGLFWRSHIDKLAYSEKENRSMADGIRMCGGEVLLDQRVLPLGTHHQKFVVARHPGAPERDVAFVGGIDLCHTRRDDERHLGDPQTVTMGDVWGPTPAWHDAMIEVRGPAVADVETNFRERWDDPEPPAPDPISRVQAAIHRDDEHADPMPAQLPDPPRSGTVNVQVLRTFPSKLPRYPFAPRGERSIARGYTKAAARAQRLIYIEDQYFWSGEVVSCFAKALREQPDLHMVVVLSTYTTADTYLANASALYSRERALRDIYEAGGDRVAVFGIENHESVPVYVHSKVCVVDDVWMTVGSDNVNRRSWTYDSELTCALLDETRDEREPRVVGADEARALARETRLRMTREHLDRAPGDDADLVDPHAWFAAMRESAARLDAWHVGGRRGQRPPGRLRSYVLPRLSPLERAVGRPIYRYADDPDGRPLSMRGTDRF